MTAQDWTISLANLAAHKCCFGMSWRERNDNDLDIDNRRTYDSKTNINSELGSRRHLISLGYQGLKRAAGLEFLKFEGLQSPMSQSYPQGFKLGPKEELARKN